MVGLPLTFRSVMPVICVTLAGIGIWGLTSWLYDATLRQWRMRTAPSSMIRALLPNPVVSMSMAT